MLMLNYNSLHVLKDLYRPVTGDWSTELGIVYDKCCTKWASVGRMFPYSSKSPCYQAIYMSLCIYLPVHTYTSSQKIWAWMCPTLEWTMLVLANQTWSMQNPCQMEACNIPRLATQRWKFCNINQVPTHCSTTWCTKQAAQNARFALLFTQDNRKNILRSLQVLVFKGRWQ